MAYLTWISDDDLKAEVGKILDTAQQAVQKANATMTRNVVDPFAVLFEIAGFKIADVASWEVTEKARQSQKTLSNAFGTFHQGVLGKVPTWVDLGIGKSADLECSARKIIAEVKNKYNTVKGADQVVVYDHLDSLVMPITSKYRGYTAYYVEIIPKPKTGKPQVYDMPFTPSDKKTKTTRLANESIRRIDGKSFYRLVTGVDDALDELYDILPVVIKDISGFTMADKEFALMNAYFKKAFA